MDDLKLLLEQRYKCKATLVTSQVVKRKYDVGFTVAKHVYTFSLEGHATAKRAFIWQDEGSVGERESTYSSMLAIPPINSPEAAVDEMKARIYRDI